jgi:AcrR family transcriptional regulator
MRAKSQFGFPSEYQELSDTQNAILKLSEILLGTLGISGLELKQIAKQLGISPSLINHYYKSTEELVFDTVLYSYQKLVTKIFEVYESEPNPEIVARGWIKEMMDWEISSPGIGVLLQFPRQALRTGAKSSKDAEKMLSHFQSEIGKIGVKNVSFMASAVRALQKNTTFKLLSGPKIASLIASDKKFAMFTSVLGFSTIGSGLWIAGRRPAGSKDSIWSKIGFDPKKQAKTTIDEFIKLIQS